LLLAWVVSCSSLIDYSIAAPQSKAKTVWQSLLDQANVQIESDHADSAIALGKAALTAALDQLKHRDTVIGKIHNEIARLYYQQGKYSDAVNEYSNALDIYHHEGFDSGHLTGWSLNGLGATYSSMGKLNEAESVLVRSSVIYDSLGPKFEADRAVALNNLANIYFRLDQLPPAESLLTEVISIRKQVLSPDDPEIASSLNLLGAIQYYRGRFDDAIQSFEGAFRVVSKNTEVTASTAAWPLINMGNVRLELGEFSQAESLYIAAEQIFESRSATGHADYASVLYQIALTQIDRGEYAEAEGLLLAGDSLLQDQFGMDYADRADFCNSLGRIYDDVRSTEQARSYYEEALRVRTLNLGAEHFDVTYDINNVGNLEMELGNLNRAESLFVRCLQIREESRDSLDQELELPLENLSLVKVKQGQYVEALSYAKRAYQIQAKAFGESHPSSARLMCLLGNIASLSGTFGEADTLFKKGLASLNQAYAPAHPELALCESWYRNHLLRIRRSDDAFNRAVRVFRMRLKLFEDNAAFLSEADAIQYAYYCQNAAAWCASIFRVIESTTTVQSDTLASILLSAKGIVTDLTLLRQSDLIHTSDTSKMKLYQEYRRAKYSLSQLYMTGDASYDQAIYQRAVDSLAAKIDELESSMGRAIHTDTDPGISHLVAVSELSEKITAGAVGIEYVFYSDSAQPDNSGKRYCAIVLKSGSHPMIVDLGPATTIDSLVDRYRRHIDRVAAGRRFPSTQDRQEYNRIVSKLSEKVISPLLRKSKQPTRLIISPDASLGLVSFGGLLGEEGKYLLEMSTISYLSTLRDLQHREDDRVGTGLLVLGNPDYDATAERRLTAISSDSESALTPNSWWAAERHRGGCLTPGNIHEPGLPGTQTEVETVAESFKRETEESAIELTGSRASEDAFKRLAPGKRILHLATHGFYSSPSCNGGSGRVAQSYQNPLLSSGLLLAGCNQLGKNRDTLGLDDGVLSALEVSALNLSGVQLVVLSACESGIGELMTGEGIWGLRRAFQLAGAHTVVSTLWPIDDRISADMMGSIYGHSIRNIPVTLREAQLEQLRKLRKAGFPDHPFLWAGFVVQGGD